MGQGCEIRSWAGGGWDGGWGAGSLEEMSSPWAALGGPEGPGPRAWTNLMEPLLLGCASKGGKNLGPKCVAAVAEA